MLRKCRGTEHCFSLVDGKGIRMSGQVMVPPCCRPKSDARVENNVIKSKSKREESRKRKVLLLKVVPAPGHTEYQCVSWWIGFTTKKTGRQGRWGCRSYRRRRRSHHLRIRQHRRRRRHHHRSRSHPEERRSCRHHHQSRSPEQGR